MSEVVNDNTADGVDANDQRENVVQYDTYKRVLGKLKKTEESTKELQERLAAYEQREREAEEKKLAEKGEYQKLLELERKKVQEYDEKLKQHERDMLDAHKLSAFTKKLGGSLGNQAYYSFVDTDAIIIDPSTGQIDETSLNHVVDQFRSEHAHLIVQPERKMLPNNGPSGQMAGKLSYEEWLKLPLVQQKARFQEMRQNDLLRG